MPKQVSHIGLRKSCGSLSVFDFHKAWGLKSKNFIKVNCNNRCNNVIEIDFDCGTAICLDD